MKIVRFKIKSLEWYYFVEKQLRHKLVLGGRWLFKGVKVRSHRAKAKIWCLSLMFDLFWLWLSFEPFSFSLGVSSPEVLVFNTFLGYFVIVLREERHTDKHTWLQKDEFGCVQDAVHLLSQITKKLAQTNKIWVNTHQLTWRFRLLFVSCLVFFSATIK